MQTSMFMVNLAARQLCDGEERPLPLVCGLCVSLTPPAVVGVRVIP